MHSDIDALPVPSTYTRVLVQAWPQHAIAMLDGIGLDLAQLATRPTLTVAQQMRVFRHAMQLMRRADWALEFGHQLNINSHGPLGFAALSAPTLGEGLAVFADFARIRAPYLGFQLREEASHLLLAIDTDAYPLAELELPLIEIFMAIANSYAEAVLGKSVVDTVLYLAHPPPPHAPRYGEFFRARCEFNAPLTGFGIPLSLRQLPCPLRDDKSYAAALARCREALDGVLRPDDVVARCSHWLAAHFEQSVAGGVPARLPQLEQLAQALCRSPRTLIRQLAQRDTRFTALREARQIEVARRLLGDARYTVGDIGELLGYGDAANFGRAFRRHSGVSPGQYRRGARGA